MINANHSPTAGLNHGSCPDAEAVRIYAVGGFSDAHAAELETHLLNCPDCETLLEGMDDPSDAMIQALASLPPSPDDEADYQQLRAAALAMPVKFADADAATAVLQGASRLADPELGPLPRRLGNYELNVCIGRGASGAVYRARHLKLDQTVAVKVLDASRAFAADSFLQEMKTIGPLAHPHIARATDAGETDGLHYLVMEYVDGIDAARLLFRNGPLQLADACEIVRQAALGLKFVHERSLVHRDIKPSNLLVTVEGQVKLLDLGIAKRSDEQSPGDRTEARPEGTLDYMAPEQWSEPAAVDARADLYSLGCTLYRLLTNGFPTKPYANGGEAQASVPRPIDRLLRRLLAEDPNDRPELIDEVIASLRPLSRGANLAALVNRVSPSNVKSKCLPTKRERWWENSPIPRRSAIAATITAGAAALLSPRLPFGSAPQLRRVEWRPLSPLRPEILLAVDGRDRVQFDYTDDGEIRLASQQLALVHLGRPVTGLFSLGVRLLPGYPQDGGVFFQGQLDMTDDGYLLNFQSVELKSNHDGSETNTDRYLLWSHWTVERSGKQLHTQQTPLADVPVELVNDPQGQKLHVTCGRQGMPEIEWNDQKLHESMWQLSSEARSLQRTSVGLLPTKFLGRLGLLNTHGSITFVQPRLAYL